MHYRLISTYGVLKLFWNDVSFCDNFMININIWCFEIGLKRSGMTYRHGININI